MKPKHRSPARDGQTAGEARQDSTAPNDAPLEQFEDAVLLLSEQGIVDCNAAALRLFHCTQHDDLAGRQLADFSPALQPDGQPSGEKLRTLLSQARRAGLARYEWVHQRRNGASFPAEVFVTGLPIGEPGPLYAVICDITERKQAAAALERTRLLLEAVIEQSPVPTVVASAPDLIVRYANRASVEQLGIADEPSYLGLSLPEAQQRQTWRDLHADGTPIVMSELPLARALRGEPTHSEELSVIRKDGTRAWELVSSTPIYDRDGTLIAGLVVFPDITDRKQAEEERARLIAILEQTSDLVSTATIDGRLTYLNAAGRRLVGWSPTEDVTQHRIADLHPDWAHHHIATTGIPTALAHGIWAKPHCAGRTTRRSRSPRSSSPTGPPQASRSICPRSCGTFAPSAGRRSNCAWRSTPSSTPDCRPSGSTVKPASCASTKPRASRWATPGTSCCR